MDASNAAYAQVIRDICHHYSLPYAEVVFADRTALTYDNVHPNVAGMADMTEQIWEALQPVLEPGSQRIKELDNPRMKIYFPKGDAVSRLVVACPGGGYSGIPGADGYEGAFWKDLFNEAGYALAVLYYSLPGGDASKPVNDIRAALNAVRANAARWKVDSEHIGVMGFSAGGHLASYAATNFTGAEKVDFQVLFYPVISLEEGKTHAGSRTNFLGPNPSDEQTALYCNEKHVSASTPRAFLAWAENDGTVPPATNGQSYYEALTAAGVPAERHIYQGSRHGWHWGSFTFDGVSVSDGTKYEHLDEAKAALSAWLKSF